MKHDPRMDISPLARDAWPRLAAYVAGEGTSEERDACERWVATSPAVQDVLVWVREEWAVRAELPRELYPADRWQEFARRLSLNVAQPSTLPIVDPVNRGSQPLRGARSRFSPRWSSVFLGVAVILLVLSVTTPASWLTHVHHPLSGPQTEYTTANGQRATITLVDGTVVSLNVASHIDIPKQFGEGRRTVHLQGEAYFRVAHTTGVPFVVDAGGVKTTVLGTEFAVRAYQPSNVQVAVQTGRVSVNNAVVNAHDIATVSDPNTNQVRVAKNQNLNTALSFVTGRLVLADISLRDAIADMNRWYDVDIRLSDATLGDMPIDAVLMSGSIGDCMEMLRNVFNVRIVRNGRTLTLYPR